MNKVLIFLILVSFIVCQSSEFKREEMRQKKREHDKRLAECILNNAQTSPKVKNVVEENKDEHLLKALLHIERKIEKSDRDIIRKCRIEVIEKEREELKQRRNPEV